MTHTYTRFFAPEDVAPVTAALAELGADFDARARFMGEEIREECSDRLDAVRLTVKRLMDRVPE